MPVPKLLHSFSIPSSTNYVNIVGGKGASVVDDSGKSYLDALATLWYCQAGHGATPIIDAIKAQLDKLVAFHTFEIFTNDPAEELAQMLADRSPWGDCRVFLGNSGSEAVDTAMKLARAAHVRNGDSDRTVIISRDRAYHGVNYGGMSAQGLPLNKEGFGPLLPDVVQAPADDLEAVATMFAQNGSRIAAVMVEPVQGAGGVFPPPEGYLEGLRRLCDQHGAFLIFDDVICGYGRLGTWTSADKFGVKPDLVTFAKGVSSGYLPVSGVLISPQIVEILEQDGDWIFRHGFTYSGHPTCTAAAVANLKLLESEQLLTRAVAIGERLSAGFQALVDDGTVSGYRGVGAVWAVQLNDDVVSKSVREKMFENGAILRNFETALAFCPPLVISNEEIDQLLDITSESIHAVA